jgi:hypothetical protein
VRNLKAFIQSNKSTLAASLPLTHTTSAYFVQKILESRSITPRPCDVYLGEKLSYFFVGRPAYKAPNKDSMHWELPSCVITKFHKSRPKRILPFDSGAFSKGFLPNYTSSFDLEDFYLENDLTSVQKYIGTFFGNSISYFNGTPKPKASFLTTHGIMPTEAPIHALLSLINGEKIARELDERRSSIECQFDVEIKVESGEIIAVILPEIYLDDNDFVKRIELDGIDLITYPIMPINSEYYYFALYERCFNYYKQNGHFDV